MRELTQVETESVSGGDIDGVAILTGAAYFAVGSLAIAALPLTGAVGLTAFGILTSARVLRFGGGLVTGLGMIDSPTRS